MSTCTFGGVVGVATVAPPVIAPPVGTPNASQNFGIQLWSCVMNSFTASSNPHCSFLLLADLAGELFPDTVLRILLIDCLGYVLLQLALLVELLGPRAGC